MNALHSPPPSPSRHSTTVNGSRSKGGPWEEHTDYALMNINTAKQHKLSNQDRCSESCGRPRCCNLSMCGLLCLLIMILFAIQIMVVIFVVIPMVHNTPPQIKNVYIELFEYGFGKDEWSFGNHSLKKWFINTTGAFGVEAYNPNPVGFYMHDWSMKAISLNLYQNAVWYFPSEISLN